MLEQFPQYFRDGVEIASCFGCFPLALWNGGRLISHDQCDSNYIKSVISSINDKGVPIRYTFTNPLITEEDLNDPFCNFCMQAADNGMNEVIVFSPVLEEYLRNRYPSFAYNSTTCKEIKNVDALNDELCKDYKYVVLDYNLNNNWEFINKLEHKEKIEVLVNAVCVPNCPRRGEHYRQIAKDQKQLLINRTLPSDKQVPVQPWSCEYGEMNCLYTIQNYPTFVSPDDIWEKYVPAGINNFKIEGRTGSLFSLIDTYCYFMIKPEYFGQARLLLLKNLQSARIISVNQPRPSKWP